MLGMLLAALVGLPARPPGRSFDVLARDSLSRAGQPAVRVLVTGAIKRVPVDIEEYGIARDTDLILLQFRYPRDLPRDSIEVGYGRVVRGLTIRADAPSRSAPRTPATLVDSVATARVVPRSPWQASAYDALIRYDSAAAGADFAVRVALVNDGESAADSVALWLWPALSLDSVRAGPSSLVPRTSGSVSWLWLPTYVGPGERAVVTYFYPAQLGPGALPSALMGMSPGGAYAVADWLPRPQPALDSAGQYAPAVRARHTLRFDLPDGWQAVAQGRLVSEALFQGRHRMTWRSDEVATAAGAFTLGPYQVATGFPGDVPVALWLTPDDSLPASAMHSLVATVQAAWAFCSRAFGRLPIGEVAVATAGVWAPRGFAGLVLLDHRTAARFGSVDSGAGTLPADVTDAVFREVARTWWGSSVAAAGGGDLPLGTVSPVGPRANLLQSKGVAAIEAVRRAIGETRFREAPLSLTHEHRNGWLTLDDVLAAVGPDGTAVLRPLLF